MIADSPVDPACVQAWDDASRLLESMGHEVEDVPVPLPPEAVPVFETCWAVLTALSVAPPGREGDLRPLTRWLSERGHAVTGPEFGLAIGEMRRLAAGALAALAPYDLVLTPTLAVPPLPVGALRDDDDPEADFEAQKAFTPVDLGLERHRHAGHLAAPALDRRRPARRRDARRTPRRGRAAAGGVGSHRGGRAMGSPQAAGVVRWTA